MTGDNATPDHTRCGLPPPRTTVCPILVADELVEGIIGRRIYCDSFELERRSDGYYDLIVTQGRNDGALTDAEAQFDA